MSTVRTPNGFTLLELIAVVAIISVLMSVAAVGISSYTRRSAVKEAARNIDGDMMAIRTAARLRQMNILIDFSSNFSYTACIDSNGDESCVPPTDTLILTRTFGNDMIRLQRDGLSFPNSLEISRVGNIQAVTDIVIRYETDPNRMYCVRMFPTGLTRVEFTETGTPPCGTVAWTRAW